MFELALVTVLACSLAVIHALYLVLGQPFINWTSGLAGLALFGELVRERTVLLGQRTFAVLEFEAEFPFKSIFPIKTSLVVARCLCRCGPRDAIPGWRDDVGCCRQSLDFVVASDSPFNGLLNRSSILFNNTFVDDRFARFHQEFVRSIGVIGVAHVIFVYGWGQRGVELD